MGARGEERVDEPVIPAEANRRLGRGRGTRTSCRQTSATAARA
jgi:hypothetical protein